MSFRRRPSQRHSLQHATHTQRVSHTRAVTSAPLETATSKSSGARKFNRLHIFAQNCRGLKTDSRLTELVHTAQWRKAFAICLSETWRGRLQRVVWPHPGVVGLVDLLQVHLQERLTNILCNRVVLSTYLYLDVHPCRLFFLGFFNRLMESELDILRLCIVFPPSHL